MNIAVLVDKNCGEEKEENTLRERLLVSNMQGQRGHLWEMRREKKVDGKKIVLSNLLIASAETHPGMKAH